MKLPVLSGRELIWFLIANGFEAVSQTGSHVRMKRRVENAVWVTVVPLHKALDPGTLLGILRQTGLSREELIAFFEK